VKRCRTFIIENGLGTIEDIGEIEKRVQQNIENAVEFAKSSPDPKPEDALKNVYY
jgi:TPP-dependent pyruvate/acetoin dehydrogenase alpha subunit